MAFAIVSTSFNVGIYHKQQTRGDLKNALTVLATDSTNWAASVSLGFPLGG